MADDPEEKCKRAWELQRNKPIEAAKLYVETADAIRGKNPSDAADRYEDAAKLLERENPNEAVRCFLLSAICGWDAYDSGCKDDQQMSVVATGLHYGRVIAKRNSIGSREQREGLYNVLYTLMRSSSGICVFTGTYRMRRDKTIPDGFKDSPEIPFRKAKSVLEKVFNELFVN